MKSFPILSLPEVTFQNLSIFLFIFNLNDVTKYFCGVTVMYDLGVLRVGINKKTYLQMLNRQCVIFRKYGSDDYDDVINSKLVFIKHFSEH